MVSRKCGQGKRAWGETWPEAQSRLAEPAPLAEPRPASGQQMIGGPREPACRRGLRGRVVGVSSVLLPAAKVHSESFSGLHGSFSRKSLGIQPFPRPFSTASS